VLVVALLPVPGPLDVLVGGMTELAPGTVTVGGPMFGRRTSRWTGINQRAGDGRSGF
jgi:hypothetical protein